MAAGEAPIKQAVTWIDDRLRDEPVADRLRLVLMRHLAERRQP